MIKDNLVMAEGARRYITGYQQYTEQPSLKGGQFYFSLLEEVLTLNIYRLAIASLEEGMRCWSELKTRIKDMPDSLKDELKINLNVVGLPHLLQEVPMLAEVQEHLILDVREVDV
jgi:hypothetical protein